MKHNNQLPNVHLRKHWQNRVKTWFDQAGRKKRRRLTRLKKASAIAPRPADGLLRPAVHCPTIKYNSKLRSGRGFTLEEIKAAGLHRKQARTIGISVDHRRRNRSEESLQLNVQRLKLYLSKLIIFPKNRKAPKPGDASPQECNAATQLKTKGILPINNVKVEEAPRQVTAAEAKFDAFKSLQITRLKTRYAGIREKRAKAKLEEEEMKKH